MGLLTAGLRITVEDMYTQFFKFLGRCKFCSPVRQQDLYHVGKRIFQILPKTANPVNHGGSCFLPVQDSYHDIRFDKFKSLDEGTSCSVIVDRVHLHNSGIGMLLHIHKKIIIGPSFQIGPVFPWFCTDLLSGVLAAGLETKIHIDQSVFGKHTGRDVVVERFFRQTDFRMILNDGIQRLPLSNEGLDDGSDPFRFPCCDVQSFPGIPERIVILVVGPFGIIEPSLSFTGSKRFAAVTGTDRFVPAFTGLGNIIVTGGVTDILFSTFLPVDAVKALQGKMPSFLIAVVDIPVFGNFTKYSGRILADCSGNRGPSCPLFSPV